MFLNEVILLRSIAADKTFEENERKQSRGTPKSILATATGHQIVVESLRQSLKKK